MEAVAAVEAINGIKYGASHAVSLSVQHILDCHSNHCSCKHGGTPERVDEYIIRRNSGLTTEQNYPYRAEPGTCNRRKESQRVATEERLAKLVCGQPVAGWVASDAYGIKNYRGGIYRGTCGRILDHIVAIVGFGRDENGVGILDTKEFMG